MAWARPSCQRPAHVHGDSPARSGGAAGPWHAQPVTSQESAPAHLPGDPSIWHWGYQTTAGTPLQPLPPSAHHGTFASQAEAEDWIGRYYRALLAEGVDQVALYEGEVLVYAMSLHPE